MINSIAVENFRGIRSGTLEDLAGLTILTGPNGCGKSSILDALLIAAHPRPHDALGQAVQRHPATTYGPRWLIRTGAKEAAIRVNGDSRSRESILKWESTDPPKSKIVCYVTPAVGEALTYVGNHTKYVRNTLTIEVRFNGNDPVNDGTNASVEPGFGDVRLVDPGIPLPLDKTYSEAVRQGRKKSVLAFLQDLVQDLESLQILTEEDGTPVLYVESSDGAVQAGLTGDGIQSFLQLTLEIAASPGGIVLVEEPEAYQHPRAVRQSAKVLLTALRREVQLVVTTHSLELIDAIVGEATDDDLEKIALFNLLLDRGELKSSRFDGEDIAFARETLENDLR